MRMILACYFFLKNIYRHAMAHLSQFFSSTKCNVLLIAFNLTFIIMFTFLCTVVALLHSCTKFFFWKKSKKRLLPGSSNFRCLFASNQMKCKVHKQYSHALSTTLYSKKEEAKDGRREMPQSEMFMCALRYTNIHGTPLLNLQVHSKQGKKEDC